MTSLGVRTRWRLGSIEPVEAVLEAEAADAVVVGGLDDGANDRVQARGVAASGQDTDPTNGFHTTSFVGTDVDRPERNAPGRPGPASSRYG